MQPNYPQDAWNWLDFFIVAECWITFISELNGDGQKLGISGLRAFRVLRPLRTVTRLKGLRIIVDSLINSMPLLGNTILVAFFLFIIFAITGTDNIIKALPSFSLSLSFSFDRRSRFYDVTLPM